MSKFIELNIQNEGQVFINCESIAYIRAEKTGTRIYFNSIKKEDYLFGRTVIESYEQVKGLLKS